MRTRNWSNVPVTYSIEVGPSDGTVFDTEGKEAAILTPFVGTRVDLELIIECVSTGYYDPGVLSGPIDQSYPPEGDDERTLRVAYLKGGTAERNDRIVLPRDVQTKLFNLYLDEINAVELGYAEQDGPDPDRYRD